jgi:PKHD-type hydroxylase
MNGFQFEPTPAILDPMVEVCHVPISADGIKEIVAMGEAAMLAHPEHAEGRVGFGDERLDYAARCSKIGWIFPTPDTKRLFEFMQQIVQDANSRFWNYDLWGFHDALQYTTYEGEEKGHFGWHMDAGENSGRAPRKLSISLLLSDPSEYDGGEFEYFDGQPRRLLVKDKALAIVFPSFVQHRVLPVTRGLRKVLVGWVCGPRFR